jgi:hypothetical protein
MIRHTNIYILSFIVIIYPYIIHGCDYYSTPSGLYVIHDVQQHKSSLINYYSTIVEYISIHGDIPSSLEPVFKYFPDRNFYSYCDANRPIALKNSTATDRQLEYADKNIDLKSTRADEKVIYFKVWHNSSVMNHEYIGFTIIFTVRKTWYDISYENPVIDCVDWEALINIEDDTAIPFSIMKPDGIADPVWFRLDYYLNMPYDIMEDIYWERS